MTLDEFLEAIEKCPDDKIFDRFHIGENYLIFLKADFRKVTRDLDASDKWAYNPRATEEIGLSDLGEYRLYDDVSRVVTLQVLSWIVPCFSPKGIEGYIEKGEYNMSFMLVNDILERSNLQEGVSSSKRFANVVKELILYAKENKIPKIGRAHV